MTFDPWQFLVEEKEKVLEPDLEEIIDLVLGLKDQSTREQSHYALEKNREVDTCARYVFYALLDNHTQREALLLYKKWGPSIQRIDQLFELQSTHKIGHVQVGTIIKRFYKGNYVLYNKNRSERIYDNTQLVRALVNCLGKPEYDFEVEVENVVYETPIAYYFKKLGPTKKVIEPLKVVLGYHIRSKKIHKKAAYQARQIFLRYGKGVELKLKLPRSKTDPTYNPIKEIIEKINC